MIITIEGYASEGKTAVASFIERHLGLIGIKAKVIDDGSEQYIMAEDMARKMRAVQDNNIQITIKTVQVRRESLDER